MQIDNHKYKEKFESAIRGTIFDKLSSHEQDILQELSFQYRLTFQEIRKLIEYSIDLNMWGEGSLESWWKENVLNRNMHKKIVFKKLDEFILYKRKELKRYPKDDLEKPNKNKGKKVSIEKTDKKIYGMCPVASEKTVCCNLRNIDVVENCAFGCSYCTIQSFYNRSFRFDESFSEKLKNIPIDQTRRYHYCTGQSSDSLVWGNKNGVLDDLVHFARLHPNVVLEFKTKSKNIGYFLKNEIPKNIICSWSLNTNTIVDNEEHFTAKVNDRIRAARQLANRGIQVAFHFHPIIYYEGWEEEYEYLSRQIVDTFSPKEVSFLSLGTLTFIKPVIKKIRESGIKTKILRMEFAKDPHGKLTYPDSIKIQLFNTILSFFNEWREDVFLYLCMEKREIWEQTSIGQLFNSNEEFENAIIQACFEKMN